MTTHRFEGSEPYATGRRWVVTIVECTDGRLALSGMPEDREERLMVVTRLRDLLAAISHADDVDRIGDGLLWRRYCREAFAAWQCEVTVELVTGERDLGNRRLTLPGVQCPQDAPPSRQESQQAQHEEALPAPRSGGSAIGSRAPLEPRPCGT
jgi:hypothetical protein